MAPSIKSIKPPPSRFTRWLLEGQKHVEGPAVSGQHMHTQPWWKVMCLTGVDYFSTLGYQPGIAAIAAGSLAPVATLVLVLLTLLGALPIYRLVARESPHGEGSISMLARLLPWWPGKLFVLCLLGFVATDFIITITLSAADATAHIVENPFAPAFLHGQEVLITLALISMLAVVFLKGFKEAVGIAVVLVALYLTLNFIVIGVGLYQVFTHPIAFTNWKTALFTSHGGNPILLIGFALLLFPKLALGLSGFETGVAVMPLVRGNHGDTEEKPGGRIKNTSKLLTTAALIMSAFLLTSSITTIVLIPPEAFAPGGEANGRALAYLAHTYFGDLFGTLYDISTISILWFAGASAMAGLLNIVPRYLPRYGMAPNWARVARPLVLVFTAVAFVVTIIFQANVDAQGGAYATGVLVLMSSASVAVTLSVRRRKHRRSTILFSLVTLVFIYTTVVNMIERPEGLRIAMFFIGSIVAISLISRIWRSTELRTEGVVMDEAAQRFVAEAMAHHSGVLRIVANQLDAGDAAEYEEKECAVRLDTHIPNGEPILFLEVTIGDASDFEDVIEVHGFQVDGYRVLRTRSSAVPNAIAAILMHLRDMTDKPPHAYFEWSEGNPLVYVLRFILFGEGDIAPVTHEILRKAEPNTKRRPAIHLGG